MDLGDVLGSSFKSILVGDYLSIGLFILAHFNASHIKLSIAGG